MTKKILVTGGAGYVGAALIPKMLLKGYSVTVLDLMIYGEDVLPEHDELRKVKGDIRDRGLLDEILPGHEAVIHLACISNDPSFELDPQLGKSINLDAFRPLVECSLSSGIKRFIYASSSSVYGIKKEKNVSEDISLEPLTDYSKFKAECEVILAEYNSPDFITTVIRPATVCGYSPRQRLDLVVNILTNLAYNKREISVFGGEQLRPNIHIEDITDLYCQLLEEPDSSIAGKIYNAGDLNYSVNDLAEIVKSIIGEDVKLVRVSSDDKRSYHISSERIKEEIGFEPRYGIPKAIEDLKEAFEKGLLPDSLTDPKYFNVKMMNLVNLK